MDLPNPGTPELIELARTWLAEANVVSLDTEFDMTSGDLWGISLSVPHVDASMYLPVGEGYYTLGQFHELLNPHFASDKLWIVHNVKCEGIRLPGWGFPSRPEQFRDTMLAYWILNEDIRRYGLKPMTLNLFHHKMMEYEEAAVFGRFSPEFFNYAREDAYWTMRAWKHLEPELAKQGLTKLFVELEMPVAFVVAAMEATGIGVDGKLLAEERKAAMANYESLHNKLYSLVPQDWVQRARALIAADQQAAANRLRRDHGRLLDLWDEHIAPKFVMPKKLVKAGVTEPPTDMMIQKVVAAKSLWSELGMTYRSCNPSRDPEHQFGFNMGSGPHLCWLLYDHLGLPVIATTKAGKRSTSAIVLRQLTVLTDEELDDAEDDDEDDDGGFVDVDVDEAELAKLTHAELRQVVGNVLQWRKLRSLEVKFFGPYTEKIGDGFGVIYSHFNQCATATGRFCVAADTRLDTSIGTYRISELPLTETRHVAILTHEGRMRRVLGKCLKGREAMYEVTLANGSQIRCTAGHRFLTPEGWKHLGDIRTGDTLCSAPREDPAWRVPGASHDLGRGELRATVGGEPARPRASGEVRASPTDVGDLESGLRREVRRPHSTAAQEATIVRAGREQERGEGSACCGDPARTAGTAVGRREESSDASSTLQDDRVLCQAQHRDVWAQEDELLAEADAGCGSALSAAAGGVLAGTAGGGRAVLRGPAHVLPGPVAGVHAGGRHDVVHPGAGAGLWALPRDEADPEGPCVLELEPRGDATLPWSPDCGDTAHAPVLLLQAVHGGLRVAGQEAAGRGGRGLPQDRQDYHRAGRQAISGGCSPWVPHASLLGEGCGTPVGRRDRQHSLSVVVSIVPVGVMDVWDIEVEDDHSYIAEGFVNHNSSSGPNLQQIPKKTRNSFSARPGYVFVNADFSQIELRLMAHFSGDANLVEAYTTAGDDVHTRTAKACGCTRDEAKAINFGFLYGMGAGKYRLMTLANTGILIAIEDAQRFKDTFMRLYPGVPRYHRRIEQILTRDWFVKSMTGRRRRFIPVSRDDDPSLFFRAWRQAVNHTIQGSAADLFKIAMRNFARHKAARELEDLRWRDVRFVLQVHDELMLEAPIAIAEEAQKSLTHVMETAVKLKVPVVAEAKLGLTWADTKDKERQKAFMLKWPAIKAGAQPIALQAATA